MAWIRTQQLKQFTAFHALQQHVQQIFVGIRSMQRTNEWMIAYFSFFFYIKNKFEKKKKNKKKRRFVSFVLFENYALQNDT